MHPAGFVGRGLSRLPGAGDRSWHGSRRDSKAAAASSLHSVQSFVYLSLPAAGGVGPLAWWASLFRGSQSQLWPQTALSCGLWQFPPMISLDCLRRVSPRETEPDQPAAHPCQKAAAGHQRAPVPVSEGAVAEEGVCRLGPGGPWRYSPRAAAGRLESIWVDHGGLS